MIACGKYNKIQTIIELAEVHKEMQRPDFSSEVTDLTYRVNLWEMHLVLKPPAQEKKSLQVAQMVVSIKAEGMLVTIPQIHLGCMKEYFRPSSSLALQRCVLDATRLADL